MRLLRLTCLFVALLTIAASAQTNATGTWKAVFTGGGPKPFGNVILHLQVTGNRMTGTAHLGNTWPGQAPITDARFDGQRFSFTAIGSKGWSEFRFGGAPGASKRVDRCCPKMLFTGTIRGNAMTLAMISTSTESSSDQDSAPFSLAARKVSNNPSAIQPDEREDVLNGPKIVR
jgi:hypothetical protein